MNEKQEKLHTIKSIKHIENNTIQSKSIFACSAFIAGYFGLTTAYNIINEGVSALSKYPGATGFTVASTSLLLVGTAIYISDKIKTKKEIQELREKTGLTKEEQRKILEDLVINGNDEAIQLYDYFYGERKRKKLR
jgi:hypothetical protein